MKRVSRSLNLRFGIATSAVGSLVFGVAVFRSVATGQTFTSSWSELVLIVAAAVAFVMFSVVGVTFLAALLRLWARRSTAEDSSSTRA